VRGGESIGTAIAAAPLFFQRCYFQFFTFSLAIVKSDAR
jgi:hypothetical protein